MTICGRFYAFGLFFTPFFTLENMGVMYNENQNEKTSSQKYIQKKRGRCKKTFQKNQTQTHFMARW